MSNSNSNIISKNNQVQFSKEVLEYFESIKTDKNKEWIEKYFKVLSDPSNIIAEKFNRHHIRPCFTFKINSRTKRKEILYLADKFPQNLIKISVYNHLFAHYYLWKIYNNHDSKIAFQRMCGQNKSCLSEIELKTIALLKEQCSNYNKTYEYYKEKSREYGRTHKKERSLYYKGYLKFHKEKVKQYRLEHKEYIKTLQHQYYQNNKDKFKQYVNNNLEQINEYNKQYRESNKELLKEKSRIYRQSHRLKIKQYNDSHREERYKYYKETGCDNRACLEPIKKDTCTYAALKSRIQRHRELYNDVILKDCIIKDINLY